MYIPVPAVPLKLYGKAIPLFGLQQALCTDAANAGSLTEFSGLRLGRDGRHRFSLPGSHHPRLSGKCPRARSSSSPFYIKLLSALYHHLLHLSTKNFCIQKCVPPGCASSRPDRPGLCLKYPIIVPFSPDFLRFFRKKTVAFFSDDDIIIPLSIKWELFRHETQRAF